MKLGRDPLRDLNFDRHAALNRATRVLSEPPRASHVERPIRRGSLVQRFVLPIELCPTTNITRHSRPGQHAKHKALILALFQQQARMLRARHPLPGRPQILCMRLSSVEPDAYSDWAKSAVDKLCVPRGSRKTGLGLLRDDRPKDASVHQWWEPAKHGDGLVYIEVRSGD